MIKIAVLVKIFKGDISPFDESALECALSVEDADITVISMSPLSDIEKMKYFTRFNIKATLISDKTFVGSDTLATSKILANYLKKLDVDLVLTGRQSMNGDTAQVPGEISNLLNYKFIPYVMDFNLKSVETRLGKRKVIFPCVMSLEKIRPLRLPSIFSKSSDVDIIDNSTLKMNINEVGFNGSPTKVIKLFDKEDGRRFCKYIKKEDLENLINSLENQTRKKERKLESGSKFDKVWYFTNSLEKIAKNISNIAIKLNCNINDADSIVKTIKESKANIVLFPANFKFRAIAPIVASKLNVGLCADCIKLEEENGKLIMYRPALSNNTIAKVYSSSDIQMATVRVLSKSEDIVFGIGYGAKDYVDKIFELGKKFNAKFVASRKLVDKGYMPYNSQVGLTGKIIKPKIYVSFGISGASQHLVGVERAETIISINKDKNERIFDFSDYGIISDLKEFFKED